MVQNFISLFSIFLFIYCKGQKLQIVPQIGFQYYGISYISKRDTPPEDFVKSRPEFELAIGVDIKYKIKRWTHILNLQNPILGPSFAFRNIYLDQGIIPTFTGHSSSSGPNLIFLSYALQDESRKPLKFIGTSSTKFYYSVGIGIGFNKSKEYYRTVLSPWSYGRQIGDNYYHYTERYARASSIGVFLPLRAGVNFYNRKRKNFLALNAFWNQGLTKMAEYSIDYDYGYFSYPQYQRSVRDVKLKSRGTVFGATIGVPIRILK